MNISNSLMLTLILSIFSSNCLLAATLEEGRTIKLKTVNALKSTEVLPGQTITFFVSKDVKDNQKNLVISKGTRVRGTVINVSHPLGKVPGNFQVQVSEILANDGSYVKVRACKTFSGCAGSSGMEQLLSALVTQGFYWGVSNGQPAEVFKGTEITAIVDADTYIQTNYPQNNEVAMNSTTNDFHGLKPSEMSEEIK